MVCAASVYLGLASGVFQYRLLSLVPQFFKQKLRNQGLESIKPEIWQKNQRHHFGPNLKQVLLNRKYWPRSGLWSGLFPGISHQRITSSHRVAWLSKNKAVGHLLSHEALSSPKNYNPQHSRELSGSWADGAYRLILGITESTPLTAAPSDGSASEIPLFINEFLSVLWERYVGLCKCVRISVGGQKQALDALELDL